MGSWTSRVYIAVSLAGLTAWGAAWAGLLPSAVPFIANTVSDGVQRQPSIGAAGERSLIAWDSDPLTQGDNDIVARLVDGDGVAIGQEFAVNTTTAETQIRPVVAGLSDSNFVVAWESYVLLTDEDELVFQRFDSSGAMVGSEVHVDDTEFHLNADVAGTAVGFVLVWDDGFDVFGRRFDVDGLSLGDEFRVNDQVGTMYGPRVDSGSDGSFTVVWEDRSAIDGDGSGILMRRFASDGSTLTGDLQVNSRVDGDQYAPALGVRDDGAFVVVWETYGQDSVGDGAFGRAFDSSGSAVGSEFSVDNGSSPYAGYLDAGAIGDAFAVVWNEPREDGADELNAMVRRFDATGIGGQIIVVDPDDQGDQSAGVIAPNGDGALIAWQGFGLDGQDIFAQRFQLTTPAPTDTPTATPEQATPTATPTVDVPTATPTEDEPVSTPTPSPACPGDCNGDGRVTVAELVRAVNIALGSANVSVCIAVDRNSNGLVAIGEIIAAVNAALSGCD